MPTGPDGMVMGGSSSNEEVIGGAVGGAEREAEERGGKTPHPASGAGACPCKEHRPCSPGPIDELIAALCEATLGPACPRCHGLDPLPDDDRKPKVKIQPPIFKGLPGERPDAHLLATADWMEAMRFGPGDFIDHFKHTLLHLAHGLDLHQFHGDWHKFTTHFSKYFSTQGRNIKHLHERWRTFSFDPATDDIEDYIRDVREAAKQLGHGDDAVLNLLKATMSTELYGTLYGHNNLCAVMTMLKDIYAKNPQNNAAAAAGAAQGATAPFTHIRSPTRGAPKAQSDASLADRILQLTEILYRIDMNGKPPRKPFKPFITQPRRRFKPNCNGRDGHFNPSHGRSFQQNQRGRQQGFKGRFRFKRPFG